MDRIKPLDEKLTQDLLTEFKHIVVVEDNFKSGLYNSLAQFIVDHNLKNVSLHSRSVQENYHGIIGDAAYLERMHGLDPQSIRSYIKKIT